MMTMTGTEEDMDSFQGCFREVENLSLPPLSLFTSRIDHKRVEESKSNRYSN